MKNNLKLIILLCIGTKINGSFNNLKKIFLSNKDLEKNLEENIIKDLFKFFKNEGLYIYYKNTNTCYIDKNNQLKFQQAIDGNYWLARGYSTFLLFKEERDLILKDFLPKFNYIENIKTKSTIEIASNHVNTILKKLYEIQNNVKNNNNLSFQINELISSWEKYKEKVENLINELDENGKIIEKEETDPFKKICEKFRKNMIKEEKEEDKKEWEDIIKQYEEEEESLEKNIVKDLYNFFKNEEFYFTYKHTIKYINGKLDLEEINENDWLLRGYSKFFKLPFKDERDLIPKDFFPKFDYIENIKKKNTIEIGCKNVDIILKKLNKIKNTIKNNDNLSIKMKNLISSWEEYKEEIGNLVDKNELRKKEKEKEKYKEI